MGVVFRSRQGRQGRHHALRTLDIWSRGLRPHSRDPDFCVSLLTASALDIGHCLGTGDRSFFFVRIDDLMIWWFRLGVRVSTVSGFKDHLAILGVDSLSSIVNHPSFNGNLRCSPSPVGPSTPFCSQKPAFAPEIEMFWKKEPWTSFDIDP